MANFLTSEYGEINKVISFSDSVKRINQVMHIEDEGHDSGFEDGFDSGLDFGDDSGSFFEDESSSFFFEEDSESFFFEDEEPAAEEIDSNDNKELNIGSETEKDILNLIVNSYSNANSSQINAKELVNLIKEEANYNGYAYYEIPYNPKKYGHNDYSGLSDLLSQYYSLTGKLEGFIGKNDDFLSPNNIKMTIIGKY